MKYVLLLMGNVDGPRCGEDDVPGMEEYIAFQRELQEAGVFADGFELADPQETTTVMRPSRDAEPVVTAGPYAESREFVGGTRAPRSEHQHLGEGTRGGPTKTHHQT